MNYKCTYCGGEWDRRLLNKIEVGDKIRDCCPRCTNLIDVINYTRVPPTEPGWYWARNFAYDSPFGLCSVKEPYLVRIALWDIDGELYISFCGSSNFYQLSKVTGEWSERIEPPE